MTGGGGGRRDERPGAGRITWLAGEYRRATTPPHPCYVWPTEFLVLADFLDASRHHHSALQLMVGIDGVVGMDFGDGWVSLHGALVDTDVPHALDGSGGLFGLGWIESESPLGEGLRRVLDGRGWAPLEEEIATEIAAAIAPCLGEAVTCDVAHRRWRSAIAVLTGVSDDRPVTDERIVSVLLHLRETPRPPPRVVDLARLAHLSESRLQHLFREQVGVPIRRYLLWHRLLTAMGLIADGHGVTEAAHLCPGSRTRPIWHGRCAVRTASPPPNWDPPVCGCPTADDAPGTSTSVSILADSAVEAVWLPGTRSAIVTSATGLAETAVTRSSDRVAVRASDRLW